MKRFVSVALCLTFAAAVSAQMPKYGVTVVVDDKADFAKFKTYTWEHGWQAYDNGVHEAIVAGVDRELAGVGLTKNASAPADLLVTYASLRRIDVDLKSKPTTSEGTRRQYDVGTLVVLLLDPGTRKELMRGRVDQPIEAADAGKVKGVVDAALKEMFAKYPKGK